MNKVHRKLFAVFSHLWLHKFDIVLRIKRIQYVIVEMTLNQLLFTSTLRLIQK